MNQLLTHYASGALKLKNRMVMSPMTRCRAGEGGVPTSMNANYYQQRASAGLIVAEGTQISPQGVGYPATPGIHTPAQVAGWKLVTDAVHSAGGLIFLQLWHCGRVSHSFFHDGALPVAPSPVAINGKTLQFRSDGGVPFETPRPLELDEIPGVIDQYRQAAHNATAAGFDDLVSFARLFLANPDLPSRFAHGHELNEPDPSTFYGGNEKGYTDYPFASMG